MPGAGAVDIKEKPSQIKGRITFEVKQDKEKLLPGTG
jgi:hypothetical protein